jgi:hypothetical protein
MNVIKKKGDLGYRGSHAGVIQTKVATKQNPTDALTQTEELIMSILTYTLFRVIYLFSCLKKS